MHVVTFHTPKGGAGRTTSVMALASGFLNLGLNVLVADTSGTVTRKRSILRRWVEELRRKGFEPTQLGYVAFLGEEKVLDHLAVTAAQGHDILLIDTPRDLGHDHVALLSRSDLIVSPAIGALATG